MSKLVPKEVRLDTLDTIVHSVVRLDIRYQKTRGGGTGSFYNPKWHWGTGVFPFILTNAHVFRNAEVVTIHFHMRDPKKDSFQVYKSYSHVIADPQPYIFFSDDQDIDLAAMYVGGIIEFILDNFAAHEVPFIVPFSNDSILPDETLLDLGYSLSLDMLGYPNLLWDEEHNLPIYRRGYSATHPGIDYCSKPFFIADIIDTPGSSGSPVLALLRSEHVKKDIVPDGMMKFFLLGVLSSGLTRRSYICERDNELIDPPLFVEESVNLARIIRANRIIEFFDDIEKAFPDRIKLIEAM